MIEQIRADIKRDNLKALRAGWFRQTPTTFPPVVEIAVSMLAIIGCAAIVIALTWRFFPHG